jgi:hypothetical protein
MSDKNKWVSKSIFTHPFFINDYPVKSNDLNTDIWIKVYPEQA